MGPVAVSRLLIVDDDVEILSLLKKFFVQHSYEVEVAPDGEAMWAAIAQSRPNTIILDLMLPGESGLSLCQKVRAQTGIPIIMLTAMAELSDRIVGLELGADDYLTKPFAPRNCSPAYAPCNVAQVNKKVAAASSCDRSSASQVGTWISPAASCARPRT